MFDLSKLVTGKRKMPPRFVLYGPHGIGKTTFANDAKAVIIPTEDGTSEIDLYASFPKADSMQDVFDYIESLLKSEHDHKAVAIDTIDWMEKLIHEEIVKEDGAPSMERACGGYGKAYKEAQSRWYELFEKLDELREKRRMCIILLAHCKVEEYKNPMGENFDRYLLDLHVSKSINIPAKVMEWADAVLFVNYNTTVEAATKTGTGSGRRELYTEERPAFLAKNRYGLPSEMDFSWDELYKRL